MNYNYSQTMPNQNVAIGKMGDVVSFVTLDEPIKDGEQGVTWNAHATNEARLNYVVKLCKTPTNTPGTSVEEFKTECQVLAALRHPNIVRIFDYGDGYTSGGQLVAHPYYTMEFLGHGVPNFREAFDKEGSWGRKMGLCLFVLKDAASALAHVHESGHCHGDIKESNILVRSAPGKGPEITLIDFGFSHKLVAPDQATGDPPARPSKRSSIRRPNEPKSDRHYDIFQLCFMIGSYLGKCPEVDQIPEEEKKEWPIDTAGIEHLKRLLDDWGSSAANSKPDNAETNEFFDELATLTKSYELPPDVRGAVRYLSIPEIVTAAEIRQAFEAIRIPPRQLVLYTERIHKLITTPQFGALRYVRQLGLTHLVYPGAQGTRFEHSLGMYNLACHFIIRMSGHEAFRKWCESEHDVLKFIVAALLHDIGHFPFAHQLEEFLVEDFEPCDQARVQKLVSGHLGRGGEVLDELAPVLADLFNFTLTDIDDIKWIAFGQGRQESRRTPSAALSFLRELLDGPIDLDKLDYIERDAHHCGVPYGTYLDVPRIIETMRVIEGDKRRPILAFDSRIVGSLEQFATARHELYANVYWHRAVRSATAMFKHAFYLFQELIDDEGKLRALFHKTLSDDCLLFQMNDLTDLMLKNRSSNVQTLVKARAIEEILRAVSGRERILYKTVLERDRDKVKGTDYGGPFYRDQRNVARKILQKLRAADFLAPQGEGDLGEHNLLIDNRFDLFPRFDEIEILKGPSEEPTSLGEVAPSVKFLRENFSAQACKIRVFLNPNVLKPEFQSKGGRAVVRKHLEDLFPEAGGNHS